MPPELLEVQISRAEMPLELLEMPPELPEIPPELPEMPLELPGASISRRLLARPPIMEKHERFYWIV